MLSHETTDKQQVERFTVYCHTNRITGKRYVGWTSTSLHQRWLGHVGESTKTTNQNRIFYNAIRKHGSSDDIWAHEILEELDSEEAAKASEKKWIAHFNTNACSTGSGYNMTDGGDGASGRIHSSETKAKISKSLQGNKCGSGNKNRVWSEESRKKVSETLTGRKRSPEERKKLSEAMRRRWAEKKAKNENLL